MDADERRLVHPDVTRHARPRGRPSRRGCGELPSTATMWSTSHGLWNRPIDRTGQRQRARSAVGASRMPDPSTNIDDLRRVGLPASAARTSSSYRPIPDVRPVERSDDRQPAARARVIGRSQRGPSFAKPSTGRGRHAATSSAAPPDSPAASSTCRCDSSVRPRSIAWAIASGSRGIEAGRGLVEHLGERREVRADHRHAARRGLDHRQPEALLERRHHREAGTLEDRHHLVVVDATR